MKVTVNSTITYEVYGNNSVIANNGFVALKNKTADEISDMLSFSKIQNGNTTYLYYEDGIVRYWNFTTFCTGGIDCYYN